MHEALTLRRTRFANPASVDLHTRELVLRSESRSIAPYRMDLPGHTVLPALVNAHDHLQLNAIPPLPAASRFCNSYQWSAAFQPHFHSPSVKAALAVPSTTRHWHGALKNALCGATTVMHHDPLPQIAQRPQFPARAVSPYGWAHSLHLSYGPDVRESFLATPAHACWFIHLAEGVDETAAMELRELETMGCLQGNTVLIHGVGMNDSDVERLIEAGAALVWCPASNLTILGQTLSAVRLRRLFEAGRLALGTDSRLSGASDLLQELKVASAHGDFSAGELVQMVTLGGQRVVRAGSDNDVIIIRTLSADPFADLLQLTRADLRAVVRDGDPLIADPDFEAWFEQRGIAYTAVTLDGRPKLCARALLGLEDASSAALEPGLECRWNVPPS